MARLKDRQRQIPNGFKFALPEVGYVSSPFASFDAIVNSVFAVVQANPGRAQASGWPQNREDVAHWVDDFNSQLCLSNGWGDYITGINEASPPKFGPPPGRLSAVAAGAKTNAEFILSGQSPVNPDLAGSRAKTCTKCPLNQPGDLGNFFERATAEMLRKSLSALHDLNLTTQYDQHLGVCSACYCPMKLKVWYPIEFVTGNMSPETRAVLHQECWVLSESQ